MNKFNLGDEVVYKNKIGVIRFVESWTYTDKDGYQEPVNEYAVEFSDVIGLDNLWGCTKDDSYDIIAEGKGRWIDEEDLEAKL